MKRLFVWMAALMLLCTSAAAQTCTVDAAGGFTIELPDEWQVEILPLDGQPGTALKATGDGLMLVIDDQGESSFDYSQMDQAFLEDLLAEALQFVEEEGMEINDAGVCSIRGTLAIRVVVSITPELAAEVGCEVENAEWVDCMLLASTHGYAAYSLIVFSAERLTDEKIAEVDTIVSSIRFPHKD